MPLRYILALLLFVAATAGGSGYWQGHKRATAAAETGAEIALAKAQAAARTTENQLRATAAESDAKLAKEKANADEANRLYHGALRAGRKRVSIPVAAGSCPAAPGPSAAPVGETRAELDPKTAVDLDRIANDGDDAIRERNELIDRYQDAQRALKEFSDGRL